MKKNKSITIPTDLLGIVSFLIRGGNKSSQYGADSVWWLQEVTIELEEKRIIPHIIFLAFDNLPIWANEIICKFAVKKVSLTKETERFFRDRGFLYGEIPKLPKLIEVECKWNMKFFFKS